MHDRILFLFVDGIGLGTAGPSNPFSSYDLPALQAMSDGQRWTSDAEAVLSPDRLFRPIDATLDVEGLPQSGTGQASLFTGVNCAQVAGRHYGPFPHSTSRPIIAQHNVFTQLLQLPSIGTGDVAFANAYPERFFSYVRTTDRWTVTTLSCLNAGVRLHSEDDLRNEMAVAANITGAGWPGSTLPVVNEEAAAETLLRVVESRRFTLFEYYLTDKAGHGRPGADPEAVLPSLDRFIKALLAGRRPDTSIVLTSDHGNLEDVSTRSHTRNPVPLAAIGPAVPYLSAAGSILDVTPGIVASLGQSNY